MLNEIFSSFDALTERYGLEKIKTIGDAYMAATGILDETYSLDATLEATFDMIRETRELDVGWEIKVGIATGPLVAGIIGSMRLQFDIWGNTVNMAARMCDASGPGIVAIPANQLSGLTSPPPIYDTVKKQLKGIGEIEVALLSPS